MTFLADVVECPCRGNCPGGCPCDNFTCQRYAVLLDEEMRLVGKIISLDGTVFEQRRFGPFLDVELDAACYAFFRGEHMMFGGMTKKRQIAKIDGCAIVDTGSQLGYSFDSYHGKCAVIENNIGFEDDSKTERKLFC